MKYFLQNFKNNIDFFLRQHFTFSRKNYVEYNEPKDALFTEQSVIEREKYLLENYDLDYLKSNSTSQNYRENLYITDLLDKYLNVNTQDKLSVLDIGCKNWFYAKGEYAFFKKHSQNLKLDGIEIDTNRLYSNFYNRAEVAKFHIKNLNGCEYISADFLAHKGKYDYIIWILPFVVEYPQVKWGLPFKHFQPEKMLLHSVESLKLDGQILIINQGEAEYQVQKELCKKLNINYTDIGKIDEVFVDYKYPRYSILIKNESNR